MNSGGLDKRGRALEDEFFHRVDQKLMADLKAKMAADAQKDALKAACAWADDSLVDTLAENGVTAESIIALSLVPLVRVAWADRKMEDAERDAILKAADENHCEQGTVGYVLLKSWLAEAPADSLFTAWKEYTAGLSQSLSEEEMGKVKLQLMTTAEGVAKSAGGFLGLASISAQEQAVLDEIAAALG